MAEEKSTLLEVVEQLALQAVMLEPDDVMALGSILEELETIEKIGVNIGLKPIQLHSQSLRKVVEKIIVNEFSVPQEGLKLLREGVTLLQSEISHPGTTLPSEKLESSAGEFQTVSPSDGSKADQSGQAQKEALDLTQDLGLYNDFVSEALEHLGTIEMKIISLEQSPGDRSCDDKNQQK